MTDSTYLVKFLIYPPDQETGMGRRFQTPIEIQASVVNGNWEQVSLDVRNGVKEMMTVLTDDPKAYEHFLVGLEPHLVNAHKSTETDSKPSDRFNSPSPGPTGDRGGGDSRVKKIKVFRADGKDICPFCWDEGYTSTYQGQTKDHPAGSHRGIKENDLKYSAKYNRCVGMCYDHGGEYRKDSGRLVDMWMKICTDLENATSNHTYTIEDKEVLIT